MWSLYFLISFVIAKSDQDEHGNFDYIDLVDSIYSNSNIKIKSGRFTRAASPTNYVVQLQFPAQGDRPCKRNDKNYFFFTINTKFF